MTPISEHRLEAELGAIRPLPRPEFAAELDQAVADGFPDPRSPKAWLARVGERLRAAPPRRLLLPAGGVALAAIAVTTAVIAIGGEGHGANPVAVETQASPAPERGQVQFEESIPTIGRAGSAAAPKGSSSGGSAASGRATGDWSGVQFEDALPETGASQATGGVSRQPTVGPYASGAAHREVERAAQIVLAAAPSEVRDDAAQVFEAVHAADGIVLSSSVRDGRAGHAGARFELLIPAARLGDAMASFSSIATVRARHESSQDITAPTVGAAERLQDANAAVRGLLGQLAEADSDATRAATEAELRAARSKAAAIRSRLAALERRDNLSRVSLRIESGGEAGGGGAWGIGDGLHGAGRVLAIAAGVTVIAAAVLAPLALILLLAWLARSAWIRRARRHALE